MAYRQRVVAYMTEHADDYVPFLTFGEGDEETAVALVLRWVCCLSVALHRANAANFRRALSATVGRQAGARALPAGLVA